MADQRTMAELLRAPTEGYAEAIVVPPILAEHFDLKHSLINMMTLDQFFGLEKDNPHDHIRWFNKITSTIKYKDVPNSAIKLMLFPFSLAWDRYKDLLRTCPHYGFTELHQLDTFYNALNPADQDSLNFAAGGNLLERHTQDVLTIIENKSKQTSVMTTTMTAILKQFQATPPPAFVKTIKEICVTCSGAHPYYQCLAADGNTFPKFWDNIQGYVLASAVNYNQGNFGYRPLSEKDKQEKDKIGSKPGKNEKHGEAERSQKQLHEFQRVVPRNYDPKGARFLIAARFPTPPLAFLKQKNPKTVVFFSFIFILCMRTRSRSRNNSPQREASPAIVEPLRIELPFLEDQFQEDTPPESPMADNRTMAELLQAPTKGYEDAIVIPEITANNFELKHGLINLVQNKQFSDTIKKTHTLISDTSTRSPQR
nr:hypothetical protein [Tanacetum cinerariifolium]